MKQGIGDPGKKFIDVVLEKRARPQREWLTLCRDGRLDPVSFQNLDRRIQAYAALYRAKGLGQGDVVLIILRESTDIFAAFFAGIVMGVLPAFYPYPSPKQAPERFLEHISDLVRFNRVSLVVAYDEVISILEKTPFFQNENYFRGFVAYDKLDNTPFDLEGLKKEAIEEAFLQFSSGTTGAKKGVKITVQALFNQIQAYEDAVSMGESSKIVSWLPHYHDMGLIACMLMPFVKDAFVYMISPFEWVRRPEVLFEIISQVNGTHVWVPNFALGHMVNRIPTDEVSRYDLGSLTHFVLCSEPVTFNTVDRFLRRFGSCGLRPERIFNCYAMAENTFAMTTTLPGRGLRFLRLQQEPLRRSNLAIDAQEGPTSIVSGCGRPLPNVQVRIIDEAGQVCRERSIGTIHIKSDCMLKEYHHNPEETSKAISADGWLNTGDMGFVDEGELFVTGRKKELIIVGGENIYPQDIEEVLNAHQDLLPGRNVVFSLLHEDTGTERVVILAEVRGAELALSDRGALSADLRKIILDELNISVSDIVLLPPRSLKKSTAGKISRHLNREAYLAGSFREETPAVAEEATESILFMAIKGLLRERGVDTASVATITPASRLITSGLIDSFAFIDLVLRVEDAVKIKIPPQFIRVEFFDTLRDIEKLIGKLSAEQESSVEEVANCRRMSLESLSLAPGSVRPTFREWIAEHFPWPGTPLYILLLKAIGLQVSWRAIFLGNLRLKLRGDPSHIVIEDDVVIGREVDIRIREQGRIIFKRGSYLDDQIRLVAARDGMIELGEGAAIGARSIVNSGGTVRIGRHSMLSGRVAVNSSSHGIDRRSFIKGQAHRHGRVEIGDDVWVGVGASILIDTVIEEGAVISSNSLVSGHIPAFAVCAGVPAKVLYYR